MKLISDSVGVEITCNTFQDEEWHGSCIGNFLSWYSCICTDSDTDSSESIFQSLTADSISYC